VINPHYGEKFKVITSAFFQYCPDSVPWYLHETEGGIFAWLWLENLPITDVELYQLFKKSGVIVVPGSSFFPCLREEWKHKHECVRISLTATPKELEEGVRRIAQVITQVYQGSAG
jgi:valine--pyruvate aminotransferase